MGEKNIKERIWRIPDGIPLKLGNMTIRTSNSDKLLVIGKIKTIEFKNINKNTVNKELENLKNSFSKLTQSFDDLNTIIKSNNLNIEYHMAYDDGGKVEIGLCSEIDNKMNWYI